MTIKELENFNKLAKQMLTAFRKGSKVTLEPSDRAIAAIEAASGLSSREIKRLTRAKDPRKKEGEYSLDPTAAKARQYRKTGSTVGWEEQQ